MFTAPSGRRRSCTHHSPSYTSVRATQQLLTSYHSNITTNEQKKDWFLRLDPNGRIPILIDHTQSPPFPVMETSAELLYLLKFADKNDVFGFKDELERSQALQWLFFWVGIPAASDPSLTIFGLRNLSWELSVLCYISRPNQSFKIQC